MAIDVGQPQVFRYETPNLEHGKAVVGLGRTDVLRASIQVLREGGENNLHAHAGNDGFWLVLSGRVRFYGEGDVLIAELGKHEGILIPHGFKYWFESCSEEPLEILRVGGNVPSVKDERIDYTPQKDATLHSQYFEARA